LHLRADEVSPKVKEWVASHGSTWTATFSSYIVARARAGAVILVIQKIKIKLNEN